MSDLNAPAQGDDDVASGDGEELQFDQAEYTTPAPAGPTCGVCNRPIEADYYEINGKIICPTCRQQVETAWRGGSRFVRVVKASVLGTVAAIAGAILYYVIVRVTNINFGLVAVLVGFMVGGAVRKGSGNRGGGFYQALALFLTYSSIAAMIAPLAIEEYLKQARQNGQQADAAADAPGKAPLNAKTDPAAKHPADAKAEPRAANAQPPAVNQASAEKAVAAPKDPAETEQDGKDAQAPRTVDLPGFVGGLLLLLVAMIGFIYSLPILMSIAAPISGLIYCFALWEAWKINKRVQLVFNGPFRVSLDGSGGAESKVVDNDL